MFIETHPGSDLIGTILKIASYTYGPLLGLFSFGILTQRIIFDRWVVFICLIAPFICYVLSSKSESLFGGYQFGYELLILNGTLTFLGLMLISKKNKLTIE